MSILMALAFVACASIGSPDGGPYDEEPPVLLCVLNGSIMFMAELMQRLDFNCQIISIKLTSYEGTETTGKVKQAMGLTADLKGRRVISHHSFCNDRVGRRDRCQQS